MNFKQKLANILFKFQRFMQGRYGTDEITYVLLGVSLFLMLISNFDKLWFVYFLSFVPIALSVARSLSKNITARIAERERYLRLTEPIRVFLKLNKNKQRDRKTHKYFKCKNCKATLRVPKGKGKISITCPRCNCKITKKT